MSDKFSVFVIFWITGRMIIEIVKVRPRWKVNYIKAAVMDTLHFGYTGGHWHCLYIHFDGQRLVGCHELRDYGIRRDVVLTALYSRPMLGQ